MQLLGVGVRYGRRQPWVLRDVSLGLDAGDLVEVTGRNGAGTSSLLRVLAGVLPAAVGRVVDRPRSVGWAPERFPTDQPFSAGAYLLTQARVRGLSRAEATEAVGREAARLHLQPVLGTALPALSKGSAQKVGIAQAVLVRPGLLVLDEPWSGLDADAREAVPGLVAEIRQAGGGVVLTDHQRQTSGLHPTRRWHVADGAVVDQVVDPVHGASAVVQVKVPRAGLDALLAQLREQRLDPRVLDR